MMMKEDDNDMIENRWKFNDLKKMTII